MDNLLDEINIASYEIEEQIKDYELEFLSVRDNQVEWRMKFPIFVRSFYNYILEHKVIPSQSGFFQYYVNENKDSKNIQKLTDHQHEALRARLYRAYPSYIRDLHFGKFLTEKGYFDEVVYNVNMDIKDGIDLLISFGKRKFSINLHTSTSRAKKAREKKKDRHEEHNYIDIDLEIRFNGSKCVGKGKYYLYSYRELCELMGKILRSYV